MEQFSKEVGFFRYIHCTGGWRKEGKKVRFVDKNLDLETDQQNRWIHKSELKTKKEDQSIKDSELKID